MAPSPSKRPRLQLRSRVRDDALLCKLLREVGSHAEQCQEAPRRADETIASLRGELDNEIMIHRQSKEGARHSQGEVGRCLG